MPALAGIFGVPYRAYIGVLAAAALIWTFVMLILGAVLGDHWFEAVRFMRHNLTIAIVLIALIGTVVVLVLRWTRGIALATDDDDNDPPLDHTHDGTTLRLTLHGMEWRQREEPTS
jgi:uncharacterized membrane protein YeaQ/YmgE (transglycosylase-associated protein family)